jgi:hypothetical protein
LIAAVTPQPYRLYGWFKSFAAVPIDLSPQQLAYPISSPMIRFSAWWWRRRPISEAA